MYLKEEEEERRKHISNSRNSHNRMKQMNRKSNRFSLKERKFQFNLKCLAFIMPHWNGSKMHTTDLRHYLRRSVVCICLCLFLSLILSFCLSLFATSYLYPYHSSYLYPYPYSYFYSYSYPIVILFLSYSSSSSYLVVHSLVVPPMSLSAMCCIHMFGAFDVD